MRDTEQTLRKKLMELSDSVYIPNDTRDYTGVKISIEVNDILAVIDESNKAYLLSVLPEKKPYEDGDHEDANWERRFIKAAHNNCIDTIKKNAGIENE